MKSIIFQTFILFLFFFLFFTLSLNPQHSPTFYRFHLGISNQSVISFTFHSYFHQLKLWINFSHISFLFIDEQTNLLIYWMEHSILPPPLFNVCLYAYMYMHRLLNIIYVWSVNDAEQILNMRCVDIYLIILLNGHFWSNI